MDMWYPHTRFANTLNNQRSLFFQFKALPISCPMMAWCRAICRVRNKGYLESSPSFITPGNAQALEANDPRARVLALQVNRPSSPFGP
jgi:hypothetical protein